MRNRVLLIMYPDTFIWKQDKQVVMYNCESHLSYKFLCDNIIEYYCRCMLDIHKLYVIEIRHCDINDCNLTNWLHEITKRGMGYTKESTKFEPLMISFPPLLNLQSDIDRISVAEGRDIGEYAAENWNEFSIYLGGKNEFPDWYKQTPYPVNDCSILEFSALRAFFLTADNSYLNTINIIGDLSSYPNKEELLNLVYSIPIKKNFNLTVSQALQCAEYLKKMDFSNYELHIYYEGKKEGTTIHRQLTKKQIPFRWIYLISSEEQYAELEELEAQYGKESIEVYPIYTGGNLSFFEENVYLTEEEVLQSHYDKQDIFAHQVMNTNFWGRLSVLPNGNVYSNFNHPPLGTLRDRVYDLIVNEMNSKTAWCWTRDDMTPCKDCLYRYLCPSPSNYELVTMKPNLCRINE